jgi:hypothetical protein
MFAKNGIRIVEHFLKSKRAMLKDQFLSGAQAARADTLAVEAIF